MTQDKYEAFKKAWEDYPSQDNEGYLPDRAGFKCGFMAGARWEREACAKICHAITLQYKVLFSKMNTKDWLSEKCAEAIRGRK